MFLPESHSKSSYIVVTQLITHNDKKCFDIVVDAVNFDEPQKNKQCFQN